MSYTNKEQKDAGQEAYKDSRQLGHSKEDSRKARDNWKNTTQKNDVEEYDSSGGFSWNSDNSYDRETELNRSYYESLDPSHSDYRDLD